MSSKQIKLKDASSFQAKNQSSSVVKGCLAARPRYLAGLSVGRVASLSMPSEDTSWAVQIGSTSHSADRS